MFKFDHVRGMVEGDALHAAQVRQAIREAREVLARSEAEAVIPPPWPSAEEPGGRDEPSFEVEGRD